MSDAIDKMMDGYREIIAERDARIAELERQLGEAQKDAQRYNYLKTHHLQLGPDCWIRTGEDLDDACDAAIDAVKEPEKAG